MPADKSFAASAARALLLIFLGVVLSGGVARAEPGWGDYVNARFAYRFCYPKADFKPEREAENGDGRSFAAGDGITLMVYGRNNALDEPIKTVAADTGARLAGDGGKVTYSVVRPAMFVVSGTNADHIFYAKGLYKADQYKIFEFVYPAARARDFAAAVKKMSDCFINTGG